LVIFVADCITGKPPWKHFVQSGKVVQSMVVRYASFVVCFCSFSGSLRPLASQSQYVFSGQKKGTRLPHCLCDGRIMSQLGSPGNVEASGLNDTVVLNVGYSELQNGCALASALSGGALKHVARPDASCTRPVAPTRSISTWSDAVYGSWSGYLRPVQP